MNEFVLLAQGRQITRIPREQWAKHLTQVPEHGKSRLSFMSEAHHLVRYFVVRELPRLGKPMPPQFIAEALELSLAQTITILDELEQHLFFLVRNEAGAVTWAFPVTMEPTPHPITFSSGEQLYAA
jgi:hypothetical protein